MRRRDFLEMATILAVWAAAIALIHPRGDFPINDDWDFALGTWNFARTGHFLFTKFTAVSLRAQVLWGALWTRAFGESFEVLRLSTLTLGAVTIVVINRTLARAGVERTPRVIATLAFAFHPIFLWSACTYMTEVPYVCASAIALYCFVRGFDGPLPASRGEGLPTSELPLPASGERVGVRGVWILLGCVAVVLSWFVRQTGVVNLAAPLLLALWRRRWRDAAVIGATLIAFVGLLVFKLEWLTGSPAELATHYKMWQESSFRLPQQIEVAYHWGVFNAQNIGLFLLPLVVPLAFARWSRVQLAILACAIVLIFARVQALIAAGHPMPYFVSPFCCDIFAGNILVDFGLGPQTLRGAFPIMLPHAVRLVLTYASVLLGACVAQTLLSVPAQTRVSVPQLLSLGTALAGTAALLGSGLYVDRYALDSAWTLVIFLPLVIPWSSRGARMAAVAALVVVASFGIFSVRHYFEWNRARWRAVHDLRARGVPIQQIDAGAEVFDLYELSKGDQRMRRIFQFGVPRRRFTVAFEPLKGYRVIATYPFTGGAIYSLEAIETSD